MLPEAFKPDALYDLIRLGRDHDGGYLVERKSVQEAGALVSFGISDDWSFERSFLNCNTVPLEAYDHTTTPFLFLYKVWRLLGSILIFKKPPWLLFNAFWAPFDYYLFFRKNRIHHRLRVGGGVRNSVSLRTVMSEIQSRPVFLKIDIEGSEYEVLDDLIAHSDQCCGLAIEFHDMHLHRDEILSFLGEYPLTLVHIHGNNCGKVDSSGDPCVCEFTFARNPDILGNMPMLPHQLDQANTSRKEDLLLRFG